MISEEPSHPTNEAGSTNGFALRHPVLTYVFGDMVRGFYLVGCLGLDLFTPVQIRAWFPGQDALVLPPVIVGIFLLAYGEWRLYRRLWPRSGRPRVVEVLTKFE